MVMDSRLRPYIDVSGNQNILNLNLNAFKQEQQDTSNPLLDLPNFMDLHRLPPDRFQNQFQNHHQIQNQPSSSEEVCNEEDCDFSDIVLKYISQMLMEEDMEEKSCMFEESSELQAAEKPFYEILGQQYPHSPDQHPLDQNLDHWVDNSTTSTGSGNYYSNSSSSSSNGNPVDNSTFIFDSPQFQSYPVDYASQFTPQSSFNPLSTITVDHAADYYAEHEPAWHFRKGVEEARKFLPNSNNLFIDLESNGLFPKEPKSESNGVVIKEEKKDEYSPNGRGRKNLHREDIDVEEGRSNKHSAVFADDSAVKPEMFDQVLLCNSDKSANDAFVSTLQKALKVEMKTEASKNVQQNGQSKAANGGKSRGKKQGGKKDVVDLRTLLIHCAQAVATDDRRSAEELLKQIRQHSSPFGDGNQRLAHCFANGLEARMAGTGSQLHSALNYQRSSAADILKAYQLYLAACPFKKISNFFCNNTIYELAENTTRLHIVDFGIAYGFQWPCFIQRLARRTTPIKLRITGIDFPQPGFKPAEGVEGTGRRLAEYAKRFKLEFEYHAIAKKWETIQLEDLKIDPDETLAVTCMYRLRNLLDETVVLESPRSAVLKLIRKMNPAIFIQGVVNGAYSAPFFITRFREALFHFSSLFDMLETNVPREHPERLLLERNLFGREALNVIACEGSERIERPETYKQWQVRNMRAGFQQLPLLPECMKKARDRVKTSYHKDFVIDQDGQWMLQGWKGRIIYALSTWRPVYDS